MPTTRNKTRLVWMTLAGALVTPIGIALNSPYVKGRETVYILGALGGIIGLALLLVQPLLAGGYLAPIKMSRARFWHKVTGIGLGIAVTTHIVGLYLTSPMDMTDALLLRAPTAFSIYGVIALWSLVVTILLVALRSRWKKSPNVWKLAHNILACIVVIASVIHALLIEGLMGWYSKVMLCLLILLATLFVTVHFRIIKNSITNSDI